jgi:hypothetical protein
VTHYNCKKNIKIVVLVSDKNKMIDVTIIFMDSRNPESETKSAISVSVEGKITLNGLLNFLKENKKFPYNKYMICNNLKK